MKLSFRSRLCHRLNVQKWKPGMYIGTKRHDLKNYILAISKMHTGMQLEKAHYLPPSVTSQLFNDFAVVQWLRNAKLSYKIIIQTSHGILNLFWRFWSSGCDTVLPTLPSVFINGAHTVR